MNLYHQFKEIGRPVAFLMQCWARSFSSDPAEKEENDWAFGEVLDDVLNDPERGWQCILYAVGNPECQARLGVLAAGPLEDILSHHGAKFIDRIEAEAKANPTFAHLLGGVWQSQIPEDVWVRVQRVWDRGGWDGNAKST